MANASCHAFHNLWSAYFLSNIKTNKINIYRIMIVFVVLYKCGTWSVTLREEHRLRAFKNKVLKRISDLRVRSSGRIGGGCTMSKFHILYEMGTKFRSKI